MSTSIFAHIDRCQVKFDIADALPAITDDIARIRIEASSDIVIFVSQAQIVELRDEITTYLANKNLAEIITANAADGEQPEAHCEEVAA